MEATLAKNPKNWFAGDFTAADIIMSFPVELMDHLKGDLKNYPHLAKYVETYHERPAYKRALERGGKLEMLHVG